VQNFAAEYRRAALELESSDSGIVVAAVNCEAFGTLCQNEQIQVGHTLANASLPLSLAAGGRPPSPQSCLDSQGYPTLRALVAGPPGSPFSVEQFQEPLTSGDAIIAVSAGGRAGGIVDAPCPVSTRPGTRANAAVGKRPRGSLPGDDDIIVDPDGD
jgi:hypothetical protein